MQDFLPVTKKEMKQRGWEQVDFAYITGDAYVDHPSFGTAIISRLLESRGYKVGIIPQPDWRKKESIQVFGEPRLGFLVSAGNMDSMASNDALGMNLKNIGNLLNHKHIYFVPFGQDDPVKKPNSMIADTRLLIPTILQALKGRQYQPVLIDHKK